MSSDANADLLSRRSRKRDAHDLRNILITNGLELLAEDGIERLTLRRVAARAGVSHAAPAYHFNGLPELLGYMCAIGFEGLTQAMEDAAQKAPQTPRGKLIAICEGYVEYAMEHRGLVQLMFSNRQGVVDDAPLKPAAQRAYAVLREACAPFEPIGAEPDSTETMVWSLVHGFVLLRLGQRFDNPHRQTAEPKIADILPRLQLR